MAASFVHSRLRVLQTIWQDAISQAMPQQFDKWLATRFRALPKLGKRDRRWQADMAFACMRHAYFAAFCQAQKTGALSAEHHLALAAWSKAAPEHAWELVRKLPAAACLRWVVARILLDDSAPPPDGIAELADDHAPEVAAAKACLAALARDASLEAACLAQGIPVTVASLLGQRMARGDFDAANFLALQGRRAPLWLRVQEPQRREAVMAELRPVYDEVTSAGQAAIRVLGALGVNQHAAYVEGRVEIQDLASQMLGDAIDVKPGHLVWDTCAGGGGKSMQIAAALMGRGSVYCSDVRSWKTDEVQRRAARLGFTNVRALSWDGGAKSDFPREVAKRGGFDRVLVDAPCTGAGTWRRNPDARFRLTPALLAELTNTQAKILEHVAPAVVPGGRLVYGTCSFLVEENERIVEAFAQKHGWKILAQELVGAPKVDADTMFVAVLERL